MKLQKESHCTVGSVSIHKYKGSTEIICGAFSLTLRKRALKAWHLCDRNGYVNSWKCVYEQFVKLWRDRVRKWEWEGDRERETETERTVKLNPNTPSHAIQNTVATGNTFTTHEPRYIPHNVGLHTVYFTDCYKFLWLRSVFIFLHISLLHIQIHSSW